MIERIFRENRLKITTEIWPETMPCLVFDPLVKIINSNLDLEYSD